TAHSGVPIFWRLQCPWTRTASSGAASAAPERKSKALSSFVFFDRADIERRDDLRDLLRDGARGDRRAVVVQHGDERSGVDAGVVDEQRLQLRVAVLLDDEHLG